MSVNTAKVERRPAPGNVFDCEDHVAIERCYYFLCLNGRKMKFEDVTAALGVHPSRAGPRADAAGGAAGVDHVHREPG